MSTLKLLMHSGTGSNVCLVTSTKHLYSCVTHQGTVNGTGGGKAAVTAYGELHALFTIDNINYKMTTSRCYVMPSKKHHTLGLSSFKKAGCSKAIHDMHEKVEFHLENGKKKILLTSVISNSLDYVTLEIVPPSTCNLSNVSTLDDDVILESNRIRLNETTLNCALTAHEKGLHSSFDSDYHLCRSGQALNMPLFPKLSVDCPTCHAHK